MLSAFILSAVSCPAAPLALRLERQSRLPLSPFVLKRRLRKFRAPTADRDRPVSRRSEPSSRTTLIGEQPNPWELLHPQDAMSRRRGAKPLRRRGRSGAISLLSPERLLSDERLSRHSEPPNRYARLRRFPPCSRNEKTSLVSERGLKITRRDLLSRFHNYHRLQALSFRIRDGNARFHLDMVAGISSKTFFKSPKSVMQELRIYTRIIDRRDQNIVH